MKKIMAFILFVGMAFGVSAQSEIDALRYSQSYFGGTARSMATAGAIGAVGADVSSLSTNPAGIGLFKSSELSLTPVLSRGYTESTFLGNTEDDERHDFDLNQIGGVFVFKSVNKNNNWKNIQVAIGTNRLKDFNNRQYIRAENRDGSIMDAYWSYATDYGTDNIQPNDLEYQAGFDAYLAYEADLLYDNDGDASNGYQWNYDAIYGGVLQRDLTKTSGYLNETYFSVGANYDDKLYIGATLGLQHIFYREVSTFYETDAADTIPVFISMTQEDRLETTGSGVNLKLGVIFRPNSFLRLGAAYHTPTYFNDMYDEYQSQVHSSLEFDSGIENYSSSLAYGEFDYKLRTPSRYILSAAVFFRQSGFISLDYERINYASAELSSDFYPFDVSNDVISSAFRSTSNIRLGAEWRVDKFYLRGGYAYYGSPYEVNDKYGQTDIITLGAGYRSSRYGFDFAYMNSSMKDTYYIYDSDFVAGAVNSYNLEQYMLTFSVKF